MSKYDQMTTTFSPEGRLYQVEYALENINKCPTAVAIVTTEGIVYATQRRQKSALLDVESPQLKNLSGEKVFLIDSHVAVAVAGLGSDASILIEMARHYALHHSCTTGEPMPAEDLCHIICDQTHAYTHKGSLRPMGVALLVGAWDRYHGFQLYQTDPSGNYSAWKAYAIGQNSTTAESTLKEDWTATLTLQQGLLLAAKVLSKTSDTVTLTPERVEVATLTRAARSKPVFRILSDKDVEPIIAEADAIRKREEEEQARKERAFE